MGMMHMGGSGDRIDSPAPNDPDPNNFKIITAIDLSSWSIIVVRYPNCTNYKGIKVLVFDKSIQIIKKQTSLDPHFLEDKNKISPVARFAPTIVGIQLAINCIPKEIIKKAIEEEDLSETCEFIIHLEDASEIVASWPQWKQDAIRSALSSSSTQEE